MLIENVGKLDEDSLLSDELFAELFDIEDDVSRQRAIFALEKKAQELKKLTEFRKLFRLYDKEYKKTIKAAIISTGNDFEISVPEHDLEYMSGPWQMDETGIFTMTDKGKEYACPHPIVPVKILKGVESGLCKTTLLFKVRQSWSTINVNRSMVASAQKIVGLSEFGVQVTSENAKTLVKYLNDMEALNPDKITEQLSTSKLGWINGEFMPYSENDIIFDNDPKLMSLFRSIHPQGDRDKWMKLAKEIRKAGHIEVLIYMAASLASVLVEPCGTLPFIVSLWGGTGLGKTVALMLATSIWADPKEGAYMSDAKATTTAMEIRLDALNSLPLCIDDMAQISRQHDEDFSAIIYKWCAGKGRDRSNQQLGLNPLTKWANCTLTNGERSLITDSTQGGASNRVIDVEIAETMFKNGNKVVKVLKENFGHCGKEFVTVLQQITFAEINKRFDVLVDGLKKRAAELNTEKEDKQIIPLALILLADEISEEHIYQDGIRLDVDRCLDYLKNKMDINENRRALEYLRDKIIENGAKFEPDEEGNYKFGCWGEWKSEKTLAILPSVFSQILAGGGFQSESFLSWAAREGHIVTGEGRNLKPKMTVNGQRVRCVVFKFETETEEKPEIEPFLQLSDDELKELPFH